MIFLLICALLGSGQGSTDDQNIRIHEWAVLDLDCIDIFASGINPFVDVQIKHEDLCIPVTSMVWFHGPDFNGSMNLSLTDATLIMSSPEPDTVTPIDPARALDFYFTTEIAFYSELFFSSTQPVGTPSEPLNGNNGFSWTESYWRDVPSLWISQEDTNWMNSFFTYDINISALRWCLWIESLDEDSLLVVYDGSGLLLGIQDDELSARPVTIWKGFEPSGESCSREETMEILNSWTGNQLLQEEIEALWLTWEPLIRSRCELQERDILLFPMNASGSAQYLSRINLRPSQDYDFRIYKLFLGMKAV